MCKRRGENCGEAQKVLDRHGIPRRPGAIVAGLLAGEERFTIRGGEIVAACRIEELLVLDRL